MGWTQETDLAGLYRGADAGIWLAHMQLWRPSAPAAGAEYFRVTGLRLVTDGTMGLHCQLLTEGGAPVPGCAVAQGWADGEKLPADSVPNGGDPRGYPNRGNVVFSNALGVTEWTWGPDEGFAPESREGAHWYWVPMGPSGLYSDVLYGLGWRLGTNHAHLEPVFTRTRVTGEEPEGKKGCIPGLLEWLSERLHWAAASC